MKKAHYVRCSGKNCEELVAYPSYCPQCKNNQKLQANGERKKRQANADAAKQAKDSAWYQDDKKERKRRKK